MKITKPKTLIINRKTWYRGKDTGSKLRRAQDGMKCCLGFYANACGLPSQKITDMFGPADLDVPLPGVSRKATHGTSKLTKNTNAGWKMMDVNDNDALTERERESKLRKLFARIKVKVKFIN